MFDNSTGIIQECYMSMNVVTLIIHVCSLMNVPAGTNALYENAAAAFSHYHSCENAYSPATWMRMSTIMRHSFMARHECECRETCSNMHGINVNDNAVMIWARVGYINEYS